jgi:hypothetical protein
MALGGTAAKAVTGDSRPIEQLGLLRPAPSLLGGAIHEPQRYAE